MRRITSSELQRQLGNTLFEVQRAPVIITTQGHDRAVLIAYEDWKALDAKDKAANETGKDKKK